ncbi:putative IQ motif, EF-hand binding, P-loop containing nucleoside triphosphate hydrolase [Helianthus annuus]|nr:putative IQ motif, EF-hand binding, P-loop containing nucleoside triphosphate hydrolase [Helianthus annuus]
MGKMIRWLKTLFGFKTESNSGDRRTNIPSCIGRARRYAICSPPETPIHINNCEEQSRRAIAVAAATAAAADVAVAAAHAAYAFARLTTQIRSATASRDRENSAAIKIQSAFRGYLSRKALKALKSLVKLQALVRGYLVRKRAVQTLQGMEAMFRARSNVFARKFRLRYDEFHPRRSTRGASEGRTRSRRISSTFQIQDDGRPNPIEVDLEEPKSRLKRANTWAWAADQTPSPLLSNPRSHLSMPGSSNHHEFEFCFSTTHNTPRFAYSCGPDDYGLIYDGISKDDSFASHPGYMANTKSFRAKLRSRSAPKQRPEYGPGVKMSNGLIEVECGLDMEKSKSPSMLKNSFKNYVMDWKVLKK